MRLLVYGMLAALVILLLADTNLGRPISAKQRQSAYQAIRYMKSKGFERDSELALRLANANHIRYSRFYVGLTSLGDARGGSFGYYAYTPLLSRSRVFVGSTFWDAGDVGHASILVHELSHIRWHRGRFLRGIPRHADEAQAYLRQYDTYRTLGLTPYGTDSTVFWDMMIGIKYYVLPMQPQYAKNDDIRWALRQLDDEGKPLAGVFVAILYIVIAGILLLGGDRLGSRIACAVLKRCRIPSLLHLGEWIIVPIALLIPIIVILTIMMILLGASKANAVQVLANNLELMLLAAFLLTGIVGGFLVQARRT